MVRFQKNSLLIPHHSFVYALYMGEWRVETDFWYKYSVLTCHRLAVVTPNNTAFLWLGVETALWCSYVYLCPCLDVE
jgi:hypothetical protein